MTRVACRDCGEDHDLEDLEPSYGLPDDVFALSEAERAARALHDRNFCELKGDAGAASRWFVRSLVPFDVAGRPEPCRWGMWVELDSTAFDEVRALWTSAAQLAAGPWSAELANDAATYPSTRGLRGSLRFTDWDSVPEFLLLTEQAHPFVADQATGVSQERVLEWQLFYLHSTSGAKVSTDISPNEAPTMLECVTHGTAPSAVVCTHLVDARDRAVGFVQTSSEPADLQAWCDECEQFFEREGEMTAAFKEFTGTRLVCAFCFATIKERHTALS